MRRTQRWRLFALVAVHLLIAAHLTHWLLGGRTVGRVVLSDSMKTLELGTLNPGFLLFAFALLITLLAGRWLCGWACHMGALQDACAWLLHKLGLKTRPFRTRLLGFIPLILATYMFIWPTLRRDIIVPMLQHYQPEALRYIGQWQPFPGWHAELTSQHLWEGLPGILIAIPFLLVCGGATVLFLGNRGLCRYGCPYGGLFAPVERIAPMRVKVDINACDGCAKCTAACSSGIRVHEEIRAYGSVVSNRCIKTLDCIAVCPHDALSFGLTKPALFKGQPANSKPKRIYDTSWPEEIVVLAVFILTFFTTRGLYATIPMLMAVGLAISLAAAVHWAWRCLTHQHVRAAGMQLKRDGSLRIAGKIQLLATLLCTMLVLHSAAIRLMQWQGALHDQKVLRTREQVFLPSPPPLDPLTRHHAQTALRWYQRSAPFTKGGYALANTPEIQLRQAWLYLVVGNLDQAQTILTNMTQTNQGTDPHHADLARIFLMQSDERGAIESLTSTLDRHPDYTVSRNLLVQILLYTQGIEPAQALYEERIANAPHDAAAEASFGSFLLQIGQPAQAKEHLDRAILLDNTLVHAHHELATCYAQLGDYEQAHAVLENAKATVPQAAESFRNHQNQIPTR